MFWSAKKLAAILVPSKSITEAKTKVKAVGPTSAINNYTLLLKYILCIYHQFRFKKDQANIQVLLDCVCKINFITLAFAAKLGTKIRFTNVDTQKIYDFTLKTFEIILASFLIKTKLVKAQLFQKTVFFANTGLPMILNMFFLIFSNADVLFAKAKLIWKSYTSTKALPMIKQV